MLHHISTGFTCVMQPCQGACTWDTPPATVHPTPCTPMHVAMICATALCEACLPMASSYGAPPGRWQADALLPVKAAANASKSAASSEADAHSAWKHIKSVVKEDSKGVDLYDLFYQGGSRETQYSQNPAGVRLLPPVACAAWCRKGRLLSLAAALLSGLHRLCQGLVRDRFSHLCAVKL